MKQPTKFTVTNKPTFLNVCTISSTSVKLPAIKDKIPIGEILYVKFVEGTF